MCLQPGSRHVRGRDAVRGPRSARVVVLCRHWYVAYLNHSMPDLLAARRREATAYLAQLRKFDYDEPYDSAEIQASPLPRTT